MPGTYLYLAFLAVAVAAFALGYGAHVAQQRARETARRQAQLERTVEYLSTQNAELTRRAQPASKHDLRALERHDMGEATLFDLADMRETARLLTERIEYASRRAAHVAAGGSPDDPPTKWKNGKDRQ